MVLGSSNDQAEVRVNQENTSETQKKNKFWAQLEFVLSSFDIFFFGSVCWKQSVHYFCVWPKKYYICLEKIVILVVRNKSIIYMSPQCQPPELLGDEFRALDTALLLSWPKQIESGWPVVSKRHLNLWEKKPGACEVAIPIFI